MAPRDPAEEILAAPPLATHTQFMHLNFLAIQRADLDKIRILNEYADEV